MLQVILFLRLIATQLGRFDAIFCILLDFSSESYMLGTFSIPAYSVIMILNLCQAQSQVMFRSDYYTVVLIIIIVIINEHAYD